MRSTHRRHRAAAALAGVTALSLLATACSGGGNDDALDGATADKPVEITVYYPIQVGGPLESIFDGLVADFMAENPEIKVKAVYSGNYDETVVAVQTAIDAGDPPATAVLTSTSMFDLIDHDLVVPFDDVVTTDEQKAWMKSFYEPFMLNSQDPDGVTWGIPFQRSTIVQYWNKDLFKEAGLDPEHAPQDWDELVSIAKQVQDGSSAKWGVQIPSNGAYWLFQALAIQNGVELASPDGAKVDFDDPKVVKTLEFWLDMAQKDGVHPPGVVEWGTTPEDFLQGKVAMIWTSSGNLTNVRNNAKFDFGVDILPEGVRRGSPVGGGNFYLFADAPKEQQVAAMRLVRYLTAPEQAAKWSIATGYVATSPAAWETDAMKEYVAGFPEAQVARDQLDDAVREMSTYQQARIVKTLDSAVQAALVGDATPAEALKQAQQQADDILRPYQD